MPTLVAALRRLADLAPLVIMSGGLGPTDGDLTRVALAELAGQPLVEDEAARVALVQRFIARGRAITERQLRQTKRPATGECLPNPHGTAPGIVISVPSAQGVTQVFALPGPPGELRPMLEDHVVPRLRPDPSRVVMTRLVHLVGIGEADAVDRLGDLTKRERMPLVGITASGAVLTVRIRFEGEASIEAARAAVQEAESAVRAALGGYVFGVDHETLPSAVLARARGVGTRIVTIESCTGGLLGAMLTEVPGSSAAFAGGVVTYSNELKTALAGVPAELIEAHGAVSEQVALAMARGGVTIGEGAPGLRALAIAITGVAGPEGGSLEKPVGTVWIGIATRERAFARRFNFPGTRDDVRTRAARMGLALAYFALEGGEPGTMLWQTGGGAGEAAGGGALGGVGGQTPGGKA